MVIFIDVCYVPHNTLPSFFLYLEVNNDPTGRYYYYYPRCTDKKTQIQRNQVICLDLTNRRVELKSRKSKVIEYNITFLFQNVYV